MACRRPRRRRRAAGGVGGRRPRGGEPAPRPCGLGIGARGPGVRLWSVVEREGRGAGPELGRGGRPSQNGSLGGEGLGAVAAAGDKMCCLRAAPCARRARRVAGWRGGGFAGPRPQAASQTHTNGGWGGGAMGGRGVASSDGEGGTVQPTGTPVQHKTQSAGPGTQNIAQESGHRQAGGGPAGALARGSRACASRGAPPESARGPAPARGRRAVRAGGAARRGAGPTGLHPVRQGSTSAGFGRLRPRRGPARGWRGGARGAMCAVGLQGISCGVSGGFCIVGMQTASRAGTRGVTN
jgi:hypothetical protein